MHVKRLVLKDFRNYESAEVDFHDRRNFIIGNNAQGKTNLLEAIEFASTGRSSRTSSDHELIKKHANALSIDLTFESSLGEQTLNIHIGKNLSKKLKSGQFSLDKKININGLTYTSTRKLNGFLASVSFKSEDLNLIRGGPKYRRDWIDGLSRTLKKSYSLDLSKYTKTIAQRNRLLKILFETGSLTESDKEQMKVWNEQAALLGARLIRQRVETLDSVLPLAKHQQELISGRSEELRIEYYMKSEEEFEESYDNERQADYLIGASTSKFVLDEKQIARRLYELFKSRVQEEIARKQTLSGPHRDDIRLRLNDEDASIYASQGQQRSLVLALKLAELNLVKDHILESPVLLLDDVLAELDLNRQSFLMSSCDQEMQTIITTTHIDSFEKKWLSNAQFIEVEKGAVQVEKCPN